MIVTNKKTRINKVKNKTEIVSYKKRMELKTVNFQGCKYSFYNSIQELQNNLTKLTKLTTLTKDAKFLRMCALLITELYYKAKHYPFSPRIKKKAKQIIELLTTTFQSTTLIQAARLFSEQNPQESDLSVVFTQLLSGSNKEVLNLKPLLNDSSKLNCFES